MILKSCDFEFIKGEKNRCSLFHTYFKMADLPLLPPETTFRVEGKIAHLFYDGKTGKKEILLSISKVIHGTKNISS